MKPNLASVDVTVYKNGIVVGGADAPFRSFESSSTRSFLQDLLDGLMPDEVLTPGTKGTLLKVRYWGGGGAGGGGQVRDKRQVIYLPTSSRRRGTARPPVPPRPKISLGDSGLTGSSLTSVTSLVTGSVSEGDQGAEPPTLHPGGESKSESSETCSSLPTRSLPPKLPEVLMKAFAYLQHVNSRRDSLQRTSDKSESEATKIEVKPLTPAPSSTPAIATVTQQVTQTVTSVSTQSVHVVSHQVTQKVTTPPTVVTTAIPPEPTAPAPSEPPPRVHSCRRGSEASRHFEGVEGRRMSDARRGSDARKILDARRGSDARKGTEGRRGSDARRVSEVARRALNIGRRKSPREWNRMNRALLLHDEMEVASMGGSGRRGSIGMVVGGGVAATDVDVDSLRKRRTSVEDFLSRVPACVVKNGKIVNLREEVSDMLMGSSRKSSLTLVHTPILDEAGESQEDEDSEAEEKEEVEKEEPNKEEDKEEESSSKSPSPKLESPKADSPVQPTKQPLIGGPPTSATCMIPPSPVPLGIITKKVQEISPLAASSSVCSSKMAGAGAAGRKSSIVHPRQPVIITTLRIRAANGTQTYLIKLKANDTLEKLRAYLRSYRDGDDNFEVVRSFPLQVLDQNSATMAELGLVPNATLHLKCTGKPSPPSTLNIPSDMAHAIKVMTAGGTSSLLASSSTMGGPTSFALRGLTSEFGSSMIGGAQSLSSASMVVGLESHPMISSVGGVLPSTYAPGIGHSVLGQFYGTPGGSMAAAAVAAAASLSKQSVVQPSAPSAGAYACVGGGSVSAITNLASSAVLSFAAPPGSYTMSSTHSSPRSHPASSPAHFTGAAYHPSPTPRRSPSPALPVIPPNLHPALTPTLPHLCLPDDSHGSSTDGS
ncbi:UBX domain [Trinorchestia longiramus]|nr:UBX domain [Trinorchestia longiramus]